MCKFIKKDGKRCKNRVVKEDLCSLHYRYCIKDYCHQRPVTLKDARYIGDLYRIDWNVIPIKLFKSALDAELEHSDITGGDLDTTVKIVIAHLREAPDFYTRHFKMEKEMDSYWRYRTRPSIFKTI